MCESIVSLESVSLSGFCTYHTGGKAKALKIVYDLPSLQKCLNGEYTVIGCGSKLLVSDDGYDGTVIVMRISGIEATARGVYAYAGTPLPVLAPFCERMGKSGLEWACGIPGSVGGAVKLNAGAYGKSMSDVIDYVDVLVGDKVVSIYNRDLDFGYRTSSIPYVVVGASFVCGCDEIDQIAARRLQYTALRRERQPTGYSCGSVFVGADRPAGWYIEQAGLKGLRQGGAVISDKHANFIINEGFASSRDINTLIRTVKAEVKAKFGVSLREEVVYLGDFY